MKNKKVADLTKRVIEARHAYYNGNPIMSDAAFDVLYDELKKLDPKNSAITSVGAPVASEWKKCKHGIPMGSLDKVQNPNEMSDWIQTTSKSEDIFVTEKLDGFSIELVYEDGKFIRAVTRGDGFIGEDITINVMKINGTPHQVPDKFTGSLRGEIILRRQNHKKYFADYSNPRNAVGICKRLDGEGVQHLDIFLYQVLGDKEFKTEEAQFLWLKKAKAQIPNYSIITKKTSCFPGSKSQSDEVNDIWSNYQSSIRHTLDYDIDGLVVRINNLEKQEALGDKDMRPKGAIAFKFKHTEIESKLLDVIWQVGNTGRITPVAIVEKVLLDGAFVERASLHNVANIKKLNLEIGCTVIVSRRNAVIPYIEKRIK